MQLHIETMTCGGCARSVTKAIHSVDPAATVEADPSAHRVVVTTASPRAAIEAALAEAGYPVTQTHSAA
jgi:copper chaperone